MKCASADSTQPTFCLFNCQQEGHALAVDRVVEVIEPNRLVRLPLGPPPLLGVCAYRGGVVPVAWSGDGERPVIHDLASGVVVLIIRGRQGPWGLAIDRSGVTVAVDAWARGYDEPRSAGFLMIVGETDRAGEPLGIVDADRSWDQLRSHFVGWYGALSGRDAVSSCSPEASTDTSSTHGA